MLVIIFDDIISGCGNALVPGWRDHSGDHLRTQIQISHTLPLLLLTAAAIGRDTGGGEPNNVQDTIPGLFRRGRGRRPTAALLLPVNGHGSGFTGAIVRIGSDIDFQSEYWHVDILPCFSLAFHG